MFQHIRFGRDLVEARFHDRQAVWRLELRTLDGSVETHAANGVVTAVGLFANPRLPDIPGANGYRGVMMHPSQWPTDLQLDGQRVAIIGNGSTGVQLLAPVARAAKQVFVFQRTPQWIGPRPNYGRSIDAEVRWLLDTVPSYWNWSRFTAIMPLFNSHDEYLIEDREWQQKGGLVSKKNDEMRATLTSYIERQVGDRPDLLDRLVPSYPPLLRRPVVDNGWYQALKRDNVQLVTDPIRRLTQDGIETEDGLLRHVDIIVAATGYDIVKFLWPEEFYGVGGTNLHERWDREDPRAYAGIMMPGLPNLFML